MNHTSATPTKIATETQRQAKASGIERTQANSESLALRSRPSAARTLPPRGDNDRLQDGVGNRAQPADHAVGGDGVRGEAVLRHPRRGEGEQRDAEQPVEVGLQHPAGHALHGLHQVVVVEPVDRGIHESQQVRQQPGDGRPQVGELRPVGLAQLQHHDRDEDGDDALTEGFHSSGRQLLPLGLTVWRPPTRA